MTDQNNAAQPVLTDEEIQDIADGFDIYGAKPEFARAIESALLSKLRAPVADERAAFEAWMASQSLGFLRDGDSYSLTYARRAWDAWQARAALARTAVASAEVMDALNWVDDFIARCNRDDRGSCESVNVLRRALASAPVAPAPDGFVPVAASVLRALAEPGLIKRTLGKFSPALAAKLGFTPEEEKAIEAMYLAFGESFDYPCAPLASAPVADNWQQYALPGETTAEQVCERMNAEVTRRTVAAMRASAPVAGEARCIGYIDYKGKNAGHARAVLTTGYDENGDAWADGTKLYSAPQASGAVRDAERYQAIRAGTSYVVAHGLVSGEMLRVGGEVLDRVADAAVAAIKSRGAALASAPVAGEAQPVALVEVSVPHLRSISVKIIPDAPMPNVGDLLYAAPQASEAVPEVAGVTLDGCLETLFRVGEHLGIDYAESRKLPGAPSGVYIKAIEDRVSQARDTALEEAATLMDQTSRGTGATLIRAALSAQPGAQRPHPKQHNDGGAVYD